MDGEKIRNILGESLGDGDNIVIFEHLIEIAQLDGDMVLGSRLLSHTLVYFILVTAQIRRYALICLHYESWKAKVNEISENIF